MRDRYVRNVCSTIRVRSGGDYDVLGKMTWANRSIDVFMPTWSDMNKMTSTAFLRLIALTMIMDRMNTN